MNPGTTPALSVEEYFRHNEFPIPVPREHWELLADKAFREYLNRVALIRIRYELWLEKNDKLSKEFWPRTEARTAREYENYQIIKQWRDLMEKINLDEERAEYLRQEH
jgi:hypothetical protein